MAFTPGVDSIFSHMVYNPYFVSEVRAIPGYNEASRKVKQLIRDIVNNKRVPSSYSAARYLVDKTYVNGATEFSNEDIDWAWAIGAAGGCEFEWAED